MSQIKSLKLNIIFSNASTSKRRFILKERSTVPAIEYFLSFLLEHLMSHF